MRNRWLLIAGIALLLVGIGGASITAAVLSGGSQASSWLRDDWSGFDDAEDLDDEGSTSGGGPSSRYRDGSMDALFIEQMIPHHEDAIAMAELAGSRARRPEIRALAQDIIRTQSAEITEMREMYREYYGGDVPSSSVATGSPDAAQPNRRGRAPGQMGPGMMGRGMMGAFGPEALEELTAAEDFDRMFIQLMVPHHRMGIMMARMARSSTEREQVRDLTDAIIEGQSAEIRDMAIWYRDWYGT